MRSLVFLPPPRLDRFPNSKAGPSRSTVISFDLHGNLREQPNPTLIPSSRCTGDITELPDSTALRPLRSTRQERHDEVPDSVDPQLPLVDDAGEEEESAAVSIVPDAPEGVPWEILHGLPPAVGDEQSDRSAVTVEDVTEAEARRPAKRVRIESPVLVIETPERPPPALLKRCATSQAPARSASESASVADPSSHNDTSNVVDDLDKSRIILGDETLNGECDNSDQHDTSLNDARQDTKSFDRSILAGLPVISVLSKQTLDATEGSRDDSSMQIRAPVPAPTCRFTMFSKRPSRTILPTAPVEVPSITIEQPQSSVSVSQHSFEEPSRILSAPPYAPKGKDKDSSLHATLPSMNVRNASFEPCFDPLPSSLGSSVGGQSILPPPTLHFALSSVTPVSRILAHPTHFLSSSVRPRSVASSTPNAIGGGGGKVNLLVVVKEVGEVSRVRAKWAVDSPTKKPVAAGAALLQRSTRSEVRGGMSRAFTEALDNETSRTLPAAGDGKVERVELVVMDGRMSSTKRLVAGSSPGMELKVVEEAAEKSLFKVVVWGKLARDWTSDHSNEELDEGASRVYANANAVEASRLEGRQGPDSTEDSLLSTKLSRRTPSHTAAAAAAAAESISSTTPTALRPGDVIHLSSIALSRAAPLNSSDSPYNSSVKRSRLGTGFPRAPAEKITLVGQANTANGSSIELCYRSDIVDRAKDGTRNFDPAIADFDFKSRRIVELSKLWRT